MKTASFAALALALLPVVALAQSVTSSVSATPVAALTLQIAPSTPAPYSTISITPESTVLDLAAATITISVNGKQVGSGNAAPAHITLGGPGTRTVISATASVGGKQYSASATLLPGAVALVEEPIASAPALYRGLPLPPDGGSIRLVAVPDFETAPGARLAESALSYTWSQDGTTLESASGIGKQAIVVDAPLPYRGSKVSVSISSPDGRVTGAASIALSSQQPTVRVYADDPLQGILFDHALGGSVAVGSESTFIAVPYSFALDAGLPQINWFLSGSAAQQGALITVRPTGSGQGSATLTATASGSGTRSSAASSLTLTFGSGSSLFGL